MAANLTFEHHTTASFFEVGGWGGCVRVSRGLIWGRFCCGGTGAERGTCRPGHRCRRRDPCPAQVVIRLLGGLLSAHDLSGDPAMLDKAEDLADRLLPAFAGVNGAPALGRCRAPLLCPPVPGPAAWAVDALLVHSTAHTATH